MTTVFHARLYGKFIEITSNRRRKELYGTNQSSNFLCDSCSNIDDIRGPMHLRRETTPASWNMILHREQTHLFSYQ